MKYKILTARTVIRDTDLVLVGQNLPKSRQKWVPYSEIKKLVSATTGIPYPEGHKVKVQAKGTSSSYEVGQVKRQVKK